MAASRVESPTALFRYPYYWLMYTATHQYGDQLAFALSQDPASVDSAAWTAPDSLKEVTCGEHNFPSTLNQWHAPEALNLAKSEYLMAWSDDLFQGGTVQFSQIKPPDSTCPADSFLLVTPDLVTAVGPKPTLALAPVVLRLTGPSPMRTTTWLQLTLARPMQVHVAVYDLFGRRVRTLVNGALPAGSRTLLWDGHAEQGAPVSSGIYFVRATCRAGRQVVRIPLIR
jgi:flagellar hook capping protein FlgD